MELKRTEILDLIEQCLTALNAERPDDDPIPIGEGTPLLGGESQLDSLAFVAFVADLEERPCETENLRIHGWLDGEVSDPALWVYGADAAAIGELIAADPSLGVPLAPGVAVTGAQVVWAVREEMARTVEDVLSRRTRALLLEARASIGAAPIVAGWMARELGRDPAWEERAVADYRKLALRYVLDPA